MGCGGRALHRRPDQGQPLPPPPPPAGQWEAYFTPAAPEIGRARLFAYVVLGHLQGLVTVHGMVSLINMYRWASPCLVPVAATIGNILNCGRSLDGSPLGTAFNTTTVMKTAVMLLWACSSREEDREFSVWTMCSHAAGFCLALFVCNILFSQFATRTRNFECYASCSLLGIVYMAWEVWCGTAWPTVVTTSGVVGIEVMMHIMGGGGETTSTLLAEDGQGYGTAWSDGS